MKDNLIINGIEYTPVQKTKDPEPRVFLLRSTTPPDSPNRVWSNEVEVIYKSSKSALHNGETICVVECPVGSVVLTQQQIKEEFSKHIKYYGVISADLYLAVEKTLQGLFK